MTDPFIHIPVKINDCPTSAVIDTCSSIHIMSEKQAAKLSLTPQQPSIKIQQLTDVTESIGRITCKLSIDTVSKDVIIHVIRNFRYPLLLGINLGNKFDVNLNLKDKSASIHTTYCIAAVSEAETSITQAKAHTESSSISHSSPAQAANNQQTAVKSLSFTDTQHKQTVCSPLSSHTLSSETDNTFTADKIISTFPSAFSQDENDVGVISDTEHRIRLKDNYKIFNLRPYKKSPKEQDEIRKHVHELLEKGFIRPSSSPWAFPVLLVPKADEEYQKRLCTDFRKQNEQTVTDVHPLPRIKDIIERLQGAKYFTKLDIKWGYWHVRMHPDDVEKTAFITQDGHYEWQVMPFGLKNAPSCFQRKIQQILGPLLFQNVINYLDDLIIYSPTKEQNFKDTVQVISLLMKAGIKLKLSKCKFFETRIEILGLEVENNTVFPGKRKTAAIQSFPEPKNLKEVQRFLGLCNWFRDFIPDFTKIAVPLSSLTKKNTPFIFGHDQRSSFNQFKQILSSSPVLTIFDPGKHTELFTDASSVGVAGILCQRDESGRPQVIEFFNKSLTPEQSNWKSYDLESLALVESVEHFEHYLSGTKFTVYTDNTAVSWLLNSTKLKGKTYRWMIRMSTFDMTIKHREGKAMAHVDALSRSPIVSQTDENESVLLSFLSLLSQTKPIHASHLLSAQQKSDFSYIKNPAVNSDGLTCIIDKAGRQRIVIPSSLTRSVIDFYHENHGHPNAQKVHRMITAYYFWPDMREEIESAVRACPSCQLCKPSNQPFFGELQPLPSPSSPLELVSMDTIIMGNAAVNTHAKNIQVLIDHNTRFIWAHATPKNTFHTVRSVLTNIFKSNPWPKNILTDRGTNFTAKQFRTFLSSHNTKHLLTTSYHPACNGMCEKANRTLKERLVIAHHENPKRKWSTLLDDVIRQYNQTVHDVTGFSPSYLMFGISPPSFTADSPSPLLPLEEARKVAQERTIKHQQMKKKSFDVKHHDPHFSIGDLVKRSIPANHPSSNKLSPHFTGPFIIVSQPHPNTYVIQNQETGQKSHENVSRLRYWLSSSPSLPSPDIKEGGR